MRQRTVLWLISCLFSSWVSAQIFTGRVTAENGEPVPYAALYIREMNLGFTTDDHGYFQTRLKPGTYTCEISSLGYTSQAITFRMTEDGLEKNVVLSERVYQLREVYVTRSKEDPAYAVMRKAIAYAPYYRTCVKKYAAGTYLKGTGKVSSIPAVLKLSKSIRNESKKMLGKLFVLEEQRRVNYTAPDSWNNEVIAYSNSFPDNLRVKIETVNINLYQPRLFGKVSPLSPGAFSYYRFKLEGCYTEGEHLINKIKIIPRKDNPDLISGHMYIVEDLWCLSSAELLVTDSGVQAVLKVTCKEVKPAVFLATSTSIEAKIDMMGVRAEASYLSAIHYTNIQVDGSFAAFSKGAENRSDESAPSASLSKKQQKVRAGIEELSRKENISTRDAYRLSKLVAKSIEQADTSRTTHQYERKARAHEEKTDSLAGKRDSVYWANVRSVPLKPEELQSYAYKQKLVLMNDSLRSDSVRRKNAPMRFMHLFMNGKTVRTKNDKAWVSWKGFQSCIPESNTVDGFWIGVKLLSGMKLNEQTMLRITPEIYYTTARKSWVGRGTLSLDYAPRHVGKLVLSGGSISADFNGESGESHLINAFSSLFFGRNDMKFYDKKYLSVSNDIEITNGLLFTAGLTWERRRALDNSVKKSLFGKRVKPNLPRHPDYVLMPENELLKASFTLQITPPRYYRMFRGRKIYEDAGYPVFTLKYQRAFSHGGEAVLSPSFHRTEITAEQKIDFGMYNSIDWFIGGGAFWDVENIQFPDFKHFATTRIPVTERPFSRGFSLPDNYAFSAHTRWAEANATWSTPYLLLKHLPFLKKKRYDEALHIRSLVVFDRDPYSELGYSLGMPDLFRIGVFVGFDRLKYRSVGVSVSLPLLKLDMF